MQGGGGCGVSANENSCANHETWSPNKLWRSNSYLTYGLLLNFITSFIETYLESIVENFTVAVGIFVDGIETLSS